MPDETPQSATARVRAAVCPMHLEARVSSPQTSQALHGHPLAILERRDDDWRRVLGADGYEGWVHRGYLTEPDAPARWVEARHSLGCTIRDARGHLLHLPLGALVPAGVPLVDGEAIAEGERAERFPPVAAGIVASALERFAGTSYQWGGTTPWGADCSGLVQRVFALHGIAMPRDAWQQAELGGPAWAPVAEGLAGLRAADLLFFSDREDGRITHVGIAVDDTRMVHLALGRGGYAVERLDQTGDPYVAKLVERFRGARRGVGD